MRRISLGAEQWVIAHLRAAPSEGCLTGIWKDDPMMFPFTSVMDTRMIFMVLITTSWPTY